MAIDLEAIARETHEPKLSEHWARAHDELNRQLLEHLRVEPHTARRVLAALQRTLHFQSARKEARPASPIHLFRDLQELHGEVLEQGSAELKSKSLALQSVLSRGQREVYQKAGKAQAVQRKTASVLLRNLPKALELNQAHLEHLLGKRYAEYRGSLAGLRVELAREIAKLHPQNQKAIKEVSAWAEEPT